MAVLVPIGRNFLYDQSKTVLMETADLATALISLRCPKEKSAEMAAQLDKRAKQLAKEKNRGYDAALAHLLGLMRQGWAAKEILDNPKGESMRPDPHL